MTLAAPILFTGPLEHPAFIPSNGCCAGNFAPVRLREIRPGDKGDLTFCFEAEKTAKSPGGNFTMDQDHGVCIMQDAISLGSLDISHPVFGAIELAAGKTHGASLFTRRRT